ncbi:DMT family transporter [Teredinibacter haidensis]|uniref:DMT family transporter n=1 Tax=Teredinibacter haidensis TaxID=2731755 RepID=UPI000948EADF|nr:DMT family transporter [Teredinibacter haidensis]
MPFRLFLPVIVLVLASVLWGLSWLPLKFIHQQGVDGIPLLLISQGALALVFSPFSKLKHYIKEYFTSLLAIALFGGSAILFFTYALIYGDVIRVMVLFYLLPVWGVLGGKFFLGEQPDAVRWLGVFCALTGAVLILGAFEIFARPPSWNDIFALLSGLFFAANNMVFRGVQSLPLAPKLTAMFYGCAFLSAMLILFGVQALPSDLAPASWGWIFLYTFCWLLFANLGSQWAVTRMESGKSSIIIIVELVVAVISALILAGERLSLIEWVGCLLVVAAAFLEAGRAGTLESPEPAAE